jgi:hypothetical protein
VTVTQGAVVVAADQGFDGSTIGDSTVAVTGTIQAPPNSGVSVNGASGVVTPDGRFFVGGVPLQQGSNVLTLAVTSPDGDTASQNISVSSTGPAPFKVTVTPTQGIEPLDVVFKVDDPGNTPFGTIEFDVNGDGATDYTANDIASASPTFTLGAGYSIAKVTVKAGDGSIIYTFKQPIYVSTAADRYRLLKGVYTGLVDRLKAGSTNLALNTFPATARAAYQDIFNALGTDLATFAAQIGDVATINMADDHAEVIIVRGSGVSAQAFSIYLILGEEGVWRIESM